VGRLRTTISTSPERTTDVPAPWACRSCWLAGAVRFSASFSQEAATGTRTCLWRAIRGGWWVRSPVTAVWELSADEIATANRVLRKPQPDADASRSIDGLDLELIVNVRSHQDGRLITVALVNRTVPGTQSLDAVSLFQAEMTVEPQDGWLAPYPEAAEAETHPDDASFNLLYREARTFAVGHGCAADWADPKEGPGRLGQGRPSALVRGTQHHPRHPAERQPAHRLHGAALRGRHWRS